jgi:hypothetical protein
VRLVPAHEHTADESHGDAEDQHGRPDAPLPDAFFVRCEAFPDEPLQLAHPRMAYYGAAERGQFGFECHRDLSGSPILNDNGAPQMEHTVSLDAMCPQMPP